MKFSLITDDAWPQKWTKIKRSLTAVGRHLKVKRKKDAQKAADLNPPVPLRVKLLTVGIYRAYIPVVLLLRVIKLLPKIIERTSLLVAL